MFRQLLQNILKTLARHLITKCKPIVIAVTGTVGKTSAKEAIASVIATIHRVRTAKKNYNNEWGVPFTILDVEKSGTSFGWLGVLAKAFWNAMFVKAYPEILLLEFGIDKPGDMQKLCDIVKLDYAVITALGDVPVHVSNFSSREALWEEKLAVARGLKLDGILFYNADDPELAHRATKATSKVVAFGVKDGAHIRATNIKELRNADNLPVGVSCLIKSAVSAFPLTMPKLVGTHQLTSVLAAAALGMALEVEADDIQKTLAEFEPPTGRLKLLAGVKGSFILDDTYNASPASTKAALEVLGACAPRRRIAVLGDMLELGECTEEAHRRIGKLAVSACDALFTVGARAKFIADEARKSGLDARNVHEFDLSTQAARPLEMLLREGDAVLVKGSQGMRMEKIVEEIMAEPQRAEELLVRQDRTWKKKEVSAV